MDDLFPRGGGDDAARPIHPGMSRTSSYTKSPWIRKVNAFLFENPFCTPLDGILRKHPPLCIDRYDTMSTDVKGDAEEAQDSRPSKVYAWKRRKKRQDKEDGVTGRTAPHKRMSTELNRNFRFNLDPEYPVAPGISDSILNRNIRFQRWIAREGPEVNRNFRFTRDPEYPAPLRGNREYPLVSPLPTPSTIYRTLPPPFLG